MRSLARLSITVIAITLYGCEPRPKISHEWVTSSSHCAPVIELKVDWSADDSVPKSASVGGSTLESDGSFGLWPGSSFSRSVDPSKKGLSQWFGRFVWTGPRDKAAQVEIQLEHGGKVSPVPYDVGIPPPVSDLNLLSLGAANPDALFWADMTLQLNDEPSASVRQGRVAATLAAEQLEFKIRMCRVARVQASTGEVEIGGDSFAYRVPLTRVLATRLRAGLADVVEWPLVVDSSAGRKGHLVIRHSARDLTYAIFSNVARIPRKDAPPYRPGSPMLWTSQTHSMDLVRPAEASLADVAAVAELRAAKTTVQTCTYKRREDRAADFPEGWITRIRQDVAASVREARSGRVISSRIFSGAMPPPCPRELRFEHRGLTRANYHEDLEGPVPSSEAIQSWLKSL